VEKIINFLRNFQLAETENGYLNCTTKNYIFKELIEITKLPLDKKILAKKRMNHCIIISLAQEIRRFS